MDNGDDSAKSPNLFVPDLRAPDKVAPEHVHCVSTLVVIEPRDFLRECIACWLGTLRNEFATVAIREIDTTRQARLLADAAAVLISVNFTQNSREWVIRQVAGLRAGSAGPPIMLMVEPDDASTADHLAQELNIQGYFPTSSTAAVAEAALRLVVAGGLYFPATRDLRVRDAPPETATSAVVDCKFASAKLTPREEAVLNVLSSGAQNKIIAFQLSMSLSTVKAHVHSIIQKLKVRNRTEAVVAARAILRVDSSTGHELPRKVTFPVVHHIRPPEAKRNDADGMDAPRRRFLCSIGASRQ